MTQIIISCILATILLCTLVYTIADKKLTAKKEKEIEIRTKKHLIQTFIHKLKAAQDLRDILLIHVQMWAKGIRHENFGPDDYGMFRTNDILTMDKHEVFLGGINGLNTHTLYYWEQSSEAREQVTEQYRNHLIKNLKWLDEQL